MSSEEKDNAVDVDVSEFDVMEGFAEESEEDPEAPLRKVTRMEPDDLTKFIKEFDSGLIFSTAHMDPQQTQMMVPMVFMPIALGALAGYAEEEVAKIGLVWDYLAHAGPRSINGLPIFMGCHIMHIEDWEIALEKLRKLEAAKAAVLAEGEDDEGK